ncbi:MAG: hypothetical protein IJP27_05245 [Clostridia bacterium]|nr:hypothetical protein [Clostridia bacterium]
MGWFDFLKTGEKLNEDIKLAEYFDAYHHAADRYIASGHCVEKRRVTALGLQEFATIEIPPKIRTKEKLFRYLIKEYGFKLPVSSVAQGKDEYISLTELNPTKGTEESSGEIYKYKELFCMACKDYHMVCIEGNVGYEAAVLCRDYLIEKLGFVLINEYGLTDMVRVFSYKGNIFELEYDSYNGGDIFFRVNVENDQVPKTFFEAATHLGKLDVAKYK